MTTYPNRYYYLGPWQLKTNDMGQYYDAPNHTVGRIDMRPVQGITETFGFFSTDQQSSDSDYIYLGDDLNSDLTGLQIDAWKNSLGMSSVDGISLLDVLWDTLTVNADPEGGLRTPPIMPTHLGIQELYLGGHSLVKSHKFQGEKDQSWPVIQKVLQDQYRNLDKQKQEEKCHTDLPEKVLGAWKLKYKISDEGLFIPGDLPRIKAKTPTTSVSDDFNRPNESLDAGNWTEVDGNWSLVSNAALGVDGDAASFPAAARYETALSTDDHFSIATPKDAGAAFGLGGPAARFASGSKEFYLGLARDGSGSRELAKFVSGAKTTLDSDAGGAFGQITKIKCDGSSISLYTNSSLIFGPITDTSISGNLYTGIIAHSSAVNDCYVDDFSAEDLVVTSLPGELIVSLSDNVVSFLGKKINSGAVNTIAGSAVINNSGQDGKNGVVDALTEIDTIDILGQIGKSGFVEANAGSAIINNLGHDGKTGAIELDLQVVVKLLGLEAVIIFTGVLNSKLMDNIFSSSGSIGNNGNLTLQVENIISALTGFKGISGIADINVFTGTQILAKLGIKGDIDILLSDLDIRMVEVSVSGRIFQILISTKTGQISILQPKTGQINITTQ